MRNISRYFMMGCVLYFVINWLADNPRVINRIRHLVNSSVEEAGDIASEAI
jgi:hypothetical protein